MKPLPRFFTPWMRSVIPVLLLAVCSSVPAAHAVKPTAAGSLSYNAGSVTTPVQRWTIEELAAFTQKMFGTEAKQSEKSPQIILGTPQSNPAIAAALKQKLIQLPQGKNADQGYTLKTVGEKIYIASASDVGVMYGVYAFLEAYGAYFQISGAMLPATSSFKIKPLDVSVSPTFKYRGIMPWDNFLCGSSGYNEEDWQELLRNSTRMKLNKLDLHFYPGYYYYTEKWEGKEVPPLWAAQPANHAPQGKPGAKAFGDTKLFGVRAWEENKGNPLKAAADGQAMLRRVIDYSHDRGWVVVAGFALMQPRGGDFVMTQKSGDRSKGGNNIPDPLVEKNVEFSVQRYRRLQELYPNADYYWMWQTEAGSALYRETGKEPGAKEMREQYSYWSTNKGGEGDIDYAYLFLQVAKRLSPEERSKLATGGWATQHTFPGIDKDYPKEIIFASLNNAYPQHALKDAENYRVCQNGRRGWMIAWWEFDGNQWFPQFRTFWHEKKYKKAAEFGVESLTLLGWKLSGIEHHVRYLSEFTWNPTLSAKDFLRTYCERLYGKEGAQPMAALYDIYEDWEARTPPATPADDRFMLLGAGWCPMALPNVPFAKDGLDTEKWKRTVMRAGKIIEDQQQLLEEDRKSVAVLQELLPKLPPAGQSWAKLLVNRLEFRIIYLQATQELNRSWITYDQIAREKGIQEGLKAAKKLTERSLKLAAQSIEKYAQDIRNRGDLGVVGQLNAQFYDIIAKMDGEFRLDSVYAKLNWKNLGMNVAHRSDLSDPNCWPLRDGITTLETFIDEGKPAIRVSLGDEGKYGSRFIRKGTINLEREPLLDFYVRTTAKTPVALMFQLPDDPTWHRLDLLGKHRDHKQVDTIPAQSGLNNGQWQRVSWNLQKLVAEKFGQDSKTINHLILGAWEKTGPTAVLEFKNVCFGSFNQLDGLEVD